MAKQTTTTPTDGNGLLTERRSDFPLVKINFILMAIAAAMIIIGFALTSGGAATDPTQFNPEVFSARRIIVGPTIAFLGFIFMGVAIMWPGRKHKSDKASGEE